MRTHAREGLTHLGSDRRADRIRAHRINAANAARRYVSSLCGERASARRGATCAMKCRRRQSVASHYIEVLVISISASRCRSDVARTRHTRRVHCVSVSLLRLRTRLKELTNLRRRDGVPAARAHATTRLDRCGWFWHASRLYGFVALPRGRKKRVRHCACRTVLAC